jgi:hypothetical protein
MQTLKTNVATIKVIEVKLAIVQTLRRFRFTRKTVDSLEIVYVDLQVIKDQS